MTGLPIVIMSEVPMNSIQFDSTFILVHVSDMKFLVTKLPFQVFPINIKGSAGSLATFANSACAWAVAYTFNFMMEWSSAGIVC